MWRERPRVRLEGLLHRPDANRPRLRTSGACQAVGADVVGVGRTTNVYGFERDLGDRLSFWGSMDEQRTLPFGTPEDVRREVRERLATLEAGGGLILGPTHHVQLDTPLESFRALAEEVTGGRLPRARTGPETSSPADAASR